jgi:hypothetical protein
MFLVAARHIDGTQFVSRHAILQPAPTCQLIRLDGRQLRAARWSDPVGPPESLPVALPAEIIPLYTCRLGPAEAIFHVLTAYRDETGYLVAAWHAQPPAGLTPEETPAWAARAYDEQAALNIGPARFGLRPAEKVEIEAKLTLRQQRDPLALALTIGTALGNRDAGLTHRILRSHLYATSTPTGYAAFTARPAGGWWAKAKHAGAPGAEIRREEHLVVPDLDAGVAWASAALKAGLRPIGQMHRTCWDQVLGPDPQGDLCVLTVDRAQLGGHTLHQVEIEYGARLGRLAPDAAEAHQHVAGTAETVARTLAELGVAVRQDGLTKIEFFRRAGEPDAR